MSICVCTCIHMCLYEGTCITWYYDKLRCQSLPFTLSERLSTVPHQIPQEAGPSTSRQSASSDTLLATIWTTELQMLDTVGFMWVMGDKIRSSARQLIFLLSYLPCLETFNPHLNTGSWSTTALRVKPQTTSASIPSHS